MKRRLFGAIAAVALTLGVATSCGNGNVTTIEVCDDVSNAIRAFQLLEAKNVVSKNDESTFFTGEALTFTGKTWTSQDKKVKITLIAENLLVSSLADYDYACLPCNTAYTGKVDSSKRVAVEDDPAQVAAKANVIAARKADYLAGGDYKTKIDVLTEACLSSEVSSFFETTYLGAMTCNTTSQIDLRSEVGTAQEGTTPADKTIKVCASDVPHAEVLNGSVKQILAKKGYTLQVTILDWTLQNDAVANKDYDANYFQHVPYLQTYTGTTELFASCKVHYEPLGIYSTKHTSL